MYIVARLEQRFDLSSMTVGMLGMAFKAESDDIRSSLSYKLKRILRFKAARVLCTDPYVDERRRPLAARRGARRGRSARDRGAARQYRDLDADTPVIDMWNLLGPRESACDEPARSGSRSSSPSTTRARRSSPCLDRIVEAVTLPCEVLVVVRHARRHRPSPYVEKYARDRPAGRVRRSTRTVGDRRGAIRYGIDHARRRRRGRHDGRRLRRPAQIDELARLVERGVVVAARVALHDRRPADRRPVR